MAKKPVVGRYSLLSEVQLRVESTGALVDDAARIDAMQDATVGRLAGRLSARRQARTTVSRGHGRRCDLMTAGRRAKTGWGSVAVARLDPGIRTSASERTPDVPSTRLHASLGRDCAGAVSTVSIVGSEKRPSAHARLHRPHCIGHMGCVGLGYGRATVNSAPSWLHPSNDQQWVDVSDPSWKNIGRCSHAWHVLAPVIGSLDALANAYASHLDEILAWPTEVADCHLGTQVNDGQHAGRTLGSCQANEASIATLARRTRQRGPLAIVSARFHATPIPKHASESEFSLPLPFPLPPLRTLHPSALLSVRHTFHGIGTSPHRNLAVASASSQSLPKLQASFTRPWASHFGVNSDPDASSGTGLDPSHSSSFKLSTPSRSRSRRRLRKTSIAATGLHLLLLLGGSTAPAFNSQSDKKTQVSGALRRLCPLRITLSPVLLSGRDHPFDRTSELPS
ncbi:hypothetical protein PaG_05949 [Moesziomyces aphidis]|uniref:Uncharacterized protein n=1 Tax=Moesziomyces aphidis TaxID=84754 RepID=W3VEA0_MOEAP|nr:hypothetical protein PaG_05949 [Moesziomyces aphidis]